MDTLSLNQIEQHLHLLVKQRTVLVLPGWNGSGPDHWQTIWERKYPSLKRVVQHDWAKPRVQDWADAISEAVWRAESPVVLVAHSLACIAVAHWARTERALTRSVEAALLVTPADVEDATRSPEALRHFAPIPRGRLPFLSTVVGSENDPYMSLATARELAADWESALINAGRVGHINSASGHGLWTEGEQYLTGLLGKRMAA
jgi:predicted alpha/beta hydrolase family esterase